MENLLPKEKVLDTCSEEPEELRNFSIEEKDKLNKIFNKFQTK
jgi:hypothetical protein